MPSSFTDCTISEHILSWRPAENLLSFSPMKNLCYSILTVTLLVVMAVSASAQTKVATVDMKKLFSGYYKTKLAQSSLETRKIELRKEIKDMSDGMEKAQADYKQLLDQANDQTLSAVERDKRKQSATDKAKEVATSRGAIEQFQRQAETQLADQSQRMSANLVTEIQKAVADKAKAGGYSLVLNSGATEVVAFSNGDNDITAAVLAQLNAGAPIDVSAPSSSSLPFGSISTNAP
jgi:outer membrane protein